jgi:PKD domain
MEMENKKIQSAYLDEKVILTMVIVSMVALMVTAFQYTNHEFCAPFIIKAKAQYYRTGEPVTFETNAARIKNMEWDFGDGESNETQISSAIHSYNQPGEYIVAAKLNDACTEYKTINVSLAPRIANPSLIPVIVCPQSAEVGKPVVFRDSSDNAASWEWRFGETAAVDATAAIAYYTYKTPGLKTISLVINNDLAQTAICKLYVNEAAVKTKSNSKGGKTNNPFVIVRARPETPSLQEQNTVPSGVTEPPKPKGENISKEELERKLRMVAANLLKAEDFNSYFCNNLNTPVSLNGETITFTQLCNKMAAIQSDKKIKTLNVQQVKSNETNCIISLNVNLKLKKGFLGFFK